jgi:hypothetical protein
MKLSTVLYVVALVIVIVAADILFFRKRFWERLIANIAIVVVFAALYPKLLGKHRSR